jgi:squalene-hopene/tetraprenyl-beta-curcumene cyclase
MDIDGDKLKTTLDNIRAEFLEFRCKEGYWPGQLSSSALSTATAVFALSAVDSDKYRPIIQRGLDWLCDNCNPDGAWGDTTLSKSNISTTLLCLAALTVDENSGRCKISIKKAKSWIENKVGSLTPAMIIKAVDLQYGRDKTFSAPILTMCALSGILGQDNNVWDSITPLPFELAALPQRLFKWLNLRVVSYALPALIAVGRAHYHHRTPSNPVLRFVRHLSKDRTMQMLNRIQPENGGFLEAAPLTSFVVMSLASTGRCDSQVVKKGARFLVNSVREDGSWPIDTNLATWLTTLSVRALTAACDIHEIFSARQKMQITNWLLQQQWLHQHPYTQAAPGGWAWTDLPGAVPDADDTAGALIALNKLAPSDNRTLEAAKLAVNWLLQLQNRDGGIPTFCRGWGKLEFDRSAPDLTAHAITAWNIWRDRLDKTLSQQIDLAVQRALDYLRKAQRPDGTWIPLWFGNENAKNQANPVYGTAQVLIGLASISQRSPDPQLWMVSKAVKRLLDIQNEDGGWAAQRHLTSTMEETSLAVTALADAYKNFTWAGVYDPAKLTHNMMSAICRGTNWILENAGARPDIKPAPIGLYFAKLWYYEKLYPYIFAAAALAKADSILQSNNQ